MADQSAALQAAIWKVQNGNSFSFKLSDQTAAFQGAYNTYIDYADTKPTGNVANYQWLSPYDSNGNSTQGLVTNGVGATPEPSSFVMMGAMATAPACSITVVAANKQRSAGWAKKSGLPRFACPRPGWI